MNDVVLRTVGLGKMYHIGGEREDYRTLRGTITKAVMRPIERIRNPGAATHHSEILWAIRDINVEVKQGEVLGIIGRNGSGKSTLLKVLSHITEPSEGRAEIRGRIASLLEVGTGFHGELTGRENIYLNGAILGMTRAQMRSKFADIVEFSEIGQFLDTPVKRYSSGMYVRLAFAVAAHLDPDILVIDEVLAVGDAEFQKKCLGRMDQVAHQGRTVLFVSHSMGAVRNLCSRVIRLDAGRIVQSGDSAEVTEEYLRGSLRAETSEDLAQSVQSLAPDPLFRLTGLEIRQNGRPTLAVISSQSIEVEIRFTVPQRQSGLRVLFDLIDDDQNILFRSYHDDDQAAIPTIEPGEYVAVATIPGDLLGPRTYELNINADSRRRWLTGDGIRVPITVEAGSKPAFNQAYRDKERFRAKLLPRVEWHTERVSDIVAPSDGRP